MTNVNNIINTGKSLIKSECVLIMKGEEDAQHKVATYMPIQQHSPPIQVVYPPMQPEVEALCKVYPRYKKVGVNARDKLVALVGIGVPIIEVTITLMLGSQKARYQLLHCEVHRPEGSWMHSQK